MWAYEQILTQLAVGLEQARRMPKQPSSLFHPFPQVRRELSKGNEELRDPCHSDWEMWADLKKQLRFPDDKISFSGLEE